MDLEKTLLLRKMADGVSGNDTEILVTLDTVRSTLIPGEAAGMEQKVLPDVGQDLV